MTCTLEDLNRSVDVGLAHSEVVLWGDKSAWKACVVCFGVEIEFMSGEGWGGDG